MDRKEYLNEFFSKVEEDFELDLSKTKEGVKFALESLRNNLTLQEAVYKLQKEYCLIKIES